jgi:succinoglycan biosynthesis protein ExoM
MCAGALRPAPGNCALSKVVVVIPTFRRPTLLARLLVSLAKLATAENVVVLVADNDADQHEGFDLCCKLAATYRWPLESIVVADRGIAAVRNALVDRACDAGADFIAMLDDDEWPSPAWLDGLLHVQRETGADIVQGSVVFEGKVRSAAYSSCEGVVSIRKPSGPIPMIEGAGNLLIARACFDGIERPYFDPEFGLTGGEDAEFFVRLSRAGKHFAWADNAIAYGEIEPTRLTLRWVLTRAFSIGNSDMRVAMKYRRNGREIVREIAKIVGALIAAPLLSLLLAPFPARRLEAPQLFFRAAGKAFAVFGARHNTYLFHG